MPPMEPKNAPESSERKVEEDDEASIRYVDLPLHLTEKILCCISPLESARLATVCKSWAATVSARLAARLAPHLLVTLTREYNNVSVRRGFIVPVPLDGAVGRTRRPPAAFPARRRLENLVGKWSQCFGATPCGLVAFAAGSILLVNPVTDTVQRLVVDKTSRAVLASGGGDYWFLCFDRINRLVLFSRADASQEYWSKRLVAATADLRYNIVVAAAICNGCIYLFHMSEYLLKIDTRAPQLTLHKIWVAPLMEQHIPKRYLIECDGEVLLVRQLRARDEKFPFTFCHSQFLRVVGFEVYKLDETGRRWTPLETLNHDRALFVSPESSFAVRASEVEGCRSSCIYFVGEMQRCYLCNKKCASTWGVYSMEGRKVLFEHVVSKTGVSVEARWSSSHHTLT
ncbi:hypothetical protein EJB05_24374, partial [Eragrostis curvula]